jgi:hypothetical protein
LPYNNELFSSLHHSLMGETPKDFEALFPPKFGSKIMVSMTVNAASVHADRTHHDNVWRPCMSTVAALIIEPLGSNILGVTPEIALRFSAYFSHK